MLGDVTAIGRREVEQDRDGGTYHDLSNLGVRVDETLLEHLRPSIVSKKRGLKDWDRHTNLLVRSRQGIIRVGGRAHDGEVGVGSRLFLLFDGL